MIRLAKWFNVLALFYIVLAGQPLFVAFVVIAVLTTGWTEARREL